MDTHAVLYADEHGHPDRYADEYTNADPTRGLWHWYSVSDK